MKNRSSNLLLVNTLALLMLAVTAHAQRSDTTAIRCVTTERDAIMMRQNPGLARQHEMSEQAIQKYIQQNRNSSGARLSAEATVTIPVVVHVIHDQADNRIGGIDNFNISEDQIKSQIDVLNEDYANKSGYKGFYTDSLGVDTGIRFRLVGIVRKFTTEDEFSPLTDAKLLSGISPPWFTDKYLNIWVCRLSNNYLGSSQFPTVTELNTQTRGLSLLDASETYQLTDGIIIDSRYFGRNSTAITSKLYNLGRTTTHEVGHWLGLIHIWGDSRCGNDYCADTPRAEGSNQTTDNNCTPRFSQCNNVITRNMIENYMDYSPDVCMSIFTNDQKARMQAVLTLSPRRAKLVEYSKRTDLALTLDVYPNPVSDYLYANVYTPDYKPFSVVIYNSFGMKVLEETQNLTYIDIKNYPSGIYFLRVKMDDEIVTKRFLIR